MTTPKSISTELILLDPAQLISMIDYPPLHSPEALRQYFNFYKTNQRDQITPITIISVPIILEYMKSKQERFTQYGSQLQEFLSTHPKAQYFKLDGTHRATAGMLTSSKIRCYNIKEEHDLQTLRQHGIKGLCDNLVETLDEQERHYYDHQSFWTLQEKVKLMIKNGDIPTDLLDEKITK